jgi:uncharacterized membrane protein
MSTATAIPFTPESNESTQIVTRYRDAYHVAQTTRDFSQSVKLGGIFLGGVFVVAATIAYQLARAWHSGFPVASLSLLACAVVAVLAGRIWEKVLESQGLLLEMTIDAAVNTSPFLSNVQRAEAMSWQQEPVRTTSIPAKAA